MINHRIETPASSQEGPGPTPEQASDLTLEAWRLRVCGEADHVHEVMAGLSPPCQPRAPGEKPDWTLQIERDRDGALPGREAAEALFADRPTLTYPAPGRQMAVMEESGEGLRILGRYRPSEAAAFLEVDRAHRSTRLLMSANEPVGRWPVWLALLFFSSRMLTRGWRLLHASAVMIGESVVLFTAPSGGGKSTLAHRAHAELDARFMADDLVLVGPDGVVAGWPTRVAPPMGLARPEDARQNRPMLVHGTRRRRLFTAAEHRAAVAYAPPAPLSAIVQVSAGGLPPGRSAGVPTAILLTAAELTAVIAEAAHVPGQRLHSADLLSITGPGPVPAGTEEAGFDLVEAGIRGVRLMVDDLRALAHLPVWDALSAVLPEVSAR
ncbi:hypothetical protein ACQPYK_49215 (plasmid) [Streptosporangium sp. CA-135522]|uniref:hypothetical protein n=1 Tax=Streptosporangium sp. CA-135522 TaxID=3240072 RepID=UPI003D93446F